MFLYLQVAYLTSVRWWQWEFWQSFIVNMCMSLIITYYAASVYQTIIIQMILFLFVFFLLGKVSSKIWKRDQGKSQPYSWNRCYFCKRKCRSIWPGMQHPRDTHADVDHYYGWLLKTLETAVRPIFTLLSCTRKQGLKGKDGVHSTMLWMCNIFDIGTYKMRLQGACTVTVWSLW